MSDNCPICGERAYLYYEGFTDPEWNEQSHTDRDRPVGERFCSVEHLVAWLHKKGFEIPEKEEIEEMQGMDKELASWTEVDETGTEKKVRVVEKSGTDEIEIHTHFPEPGIHNSVTVEDDEALGRAIRNL